MNEDHFTSQYRNTRPIGTGGFSTVYEALQVKFNRRVALKVLNLGAEGTVDREAFHNECVTMGALSSHPNIVTIYDSGFTDEGLPFISMELCQETMLDKVRSDGKMKPLEVAETAAAVAKALNRAHDEGILHSDIKPQNIFFTEYGVPALGDFGIASLDSSRFGQGVSGVSLHYSAPELFDGNDPTASSDIYALGATIYTALAGRRPFADTEGESSREQTMRRVMKESPPPIAEQLVPQQLLDLVFRMLEKDPTHRPRRASSVAATLTRIAADLSASSTLPPERRDKDATIHRRTRPSFDTSAVRSGSDARRSSELAGQPFLTDDDPTRLPNRSQAPEADDITKTERSFPAGLVGLVVGVMVLAAIIGVLLQAGGDDTADPRLLEPADGTVTAPEQQQPEIIPAETSLQAPEDLLVVVQDGVATVSWTAVEGAEGYEVSDDRMGFVEDTLENEISVALDPAWPRFCPDITAFSGSRLSVTLEADGDNCVTLVSAQ